MKQLVYLTQTIKIIHADVRQVLMEYFAKMVF